MSSAKRNMKKQRPSMTNSTEPSTLESDVWPKIDFQKDVFPENCVPLASNYDTLTSINTTSNGQTTTNNNKYSTSNDDNTLTMNGGQPYHLSAQFVFSKKLAFLNVLVHVLLFLAAAFLACQSANSNVLFSLHPAFMSFGYLVLTSQAILTMSDNNYFTYKLEFKYRLLLHWLLTAIAGVLITVASVCIFMNKVHHGKSHFQSVHGILGLTTVSCTLLSIVLGVFTRFSFPLRNCVRPICTKITHSLLGVVTYVLAMTTIGFAVYSNFFIGYSEEYMRVAVVTVIGLTGIYVLIKPVALLYARLEEVVRQ